MSVIDTFLQKINARIPRSRWLWHDAAGVFIIFLGVVLLITLLGLNSGGIIGKVGGILRTGMGIGAYVFCFILIGIGIPIALNSPIMWGTNLWRRVVLAEIGFLAFLAMLHTLYALLGGASGVAESARTAQSGSGGGAIGWVLSELLWRFVGNTTTLSRLLSFTIWFGLVMGAFAIFILPTLLIFLKLGNTATSQPTPLPATSNPTLKAPTPQQKGESAPPPPPPRRTTATVAKATPKSEDLQSSPTKKKKDVYIAVDRAESLPPLTLLKMLKEVKDKGTNIHEQIRIIEQTLQHFGLVGIVKEYRRGPTVTQFGVEPGYIDRSGPNGEARQQKIRVGQIAALRDDLALALSASSLRIEAPIPGKHLVGIEVPNTSISTVDLRSVIESENFQKITSPLAIALGKNVSGENIAADLARMPHLLIAGTTGSGKSVCMNTIIVCLVMNNRPSDLRLVLIDPKRVELTQYARLPHVLGKPESDIERIPGVLRWVTKEMDRRYQRFAMVGARNISDYNDGADRRAKDDNFRVAGLAEKLPRIVVLIDELADLMLLAPVETEKTLCRLAQMARATGIHLVVATQRPSVDVITGLLKANFPARISFAVASAIDSRVVLDQVGAEQLLGRGDMLFQSPEAATVMRLQGCFVSDNEIENVLTWWRSNIESNEDNFDNDAPTSPTEFSPQTNHAPWEIAVAEVAREKALTSGSSRGRTMRGASMGGGAVEETLDDGLVEKAMEIIRTSGSVSTSLLQRKLRIGYPRAARLMEELQQMGYVGAPSKQAGKGRDVNKEA